jgi:hypothetical protein
MWVLYTPAPAQDAQCWPGRRLLALVDAVMWPTVLALVIFRLPLGAGLVAPVALALCVLIAFRRGVCAQWHCERYHFTTWRLGVPLVALLALGVVLSLSTLQRMSLSGRQAVAICSICPQPICAIRRLGPPISRGPESAWSPSSGKSASG